MSLQVWLPLTKDTRNQGLNTGTINWTTAAAFTNNGKLGKALSTGGCTMPASMTSQVLNNTAVSIACWLYVNADADDATNRAMIFGNDSTSTLGGRQFSIFRYPNSDDIHLSWQSAASGSVVVGGVWSGVLTPHAWNHICITYQNPNVKIYVNGIQVGSTSGVMNANSFAYDTNIIHSSSSHYINDFRIYNHCLSEAEVKKLAQGLILHYPLNRGGWGQENLLKGTQLLDIDATIPNGVTKTANAYQGFTSVTYNNNSGTSLHELLAWNSKVTVKSKEVYTVSFYAKSPTSALLTCYFYNNSSGIVQVSTGRASTGDITLAADGNIPIRLTPTWTKYWITWTFDDTATSATKSLLFRSLAGQGEMSICEIKLEKGSIATPWCPNSSDVLATTIGLNGTTEYDISGFCNNGTRVGTFEWSSDTPKYSVSTVFNASHPDYIKIPYTNYAIQEAKEMTWSIWAYDDDWSTYSGRIYSCTEGGGVNIEESSSTLNWAVNMYTAADYSTYAYQGYCSINKASLSSGWHMFTWVYTTTGTKVYVDGVLKSTVDINSYGIHFANTALYLGAEAQGETTTTGYYLTGKLSDFRIYATALSAADVKSLYQNNAAIDSDGTIHGKIRD